MISLELDQHLCIRCGRCVGVCPQRILGVRQDGTINISRHGLEALCIQCGHCVAVCPKGALMLGNTDPSTLQPIADAPLSDIQRDMLFKARRSIRLYKEDPVSRDVLLKALEEARYAPTATNTEQVTWLLIEGRDRLHAIGERMAAWASGLSGRYTRIADAFHAGKDPFFRGAPAAIFALGDADKPWSTFDCSAAVSYLELALHSYGIGTCWAGFVLAAASQGTDLGISIPEGRKLCAGLMIGHSAIRYARIPPRKPVRLTVAE